MDAEVLKKAGINYEEGLRRFGGSRVLYEEYIRLFVEESVFQELETLMEEKEYGRAFRKAHDLKGMVGNMSFTDFYQKVFDLVEALRVAQNEEAERLLPGVREEYQRLIGAIKSQM